MIIQDIKELEEKSIYIIRETTNNFKNVAALWSMGKDSTSMLMLARKAFLGKVPFPVIHIDNGIDFPETYKFRDELAKKWDLLYPMLKIYTMEDIDTVMRNLISEEDIWEKKNGVWAVYHKVEED